MRSVLPMLVLLAAFNVHAPRAQTAATAPDGEATSPAGGAEATDEIVVRGKRLSELRYEVQALREHAFAVFNALNSNDEFDIHCRDERKYHSRTTRRVCAARFETDISSDAAQEYMSALRFACRPAAGQQFSLTDCMFSDASQNARSRAQAVEGEAPPKRDALTEEIWRVARENEAFAQAILDYFEMSQQYDAATRRRRGD